MCDGASVNEQKRGVGDDLIDQIKLGSRACWQWFRRLPTPVQAAAWVGLIAFIVVGNLTYDKPSADGTGQPAARDSSTSTASERTLDRADRRKMRDQRFFVRVDNVAVTLDGAISEAQTGSVSEGRAAIARARRRLVNLTYERAFQGGDLSRGAEAIKSFASDALSAVDRGDQPRLAQIRRELPRPRTRWRTR